MRLVHLADLHLGFRQYQRLTASGTNQREDDVAATVQRAITQIIEVAPDLVVIGGDVLFKGSVGRVDLPGCNKQDLIDSVQQKMYALPDEFAVLPGHGEITTIGAEKQTNHFIRADDVSF